MALCEDSKGPQDPCVVRCAAHSGRLLRSYGQGALLTRRFKGVWGRIATPPASLVLSPGERTNPGLLPLGKKGPAGAGRGSFPLRVGRFPAQGGLSGRPPLTSFGYSLMMALVHAAENMQGVFFLCK